MYHPMKSHLPLPQNPHARVLPVIAWRPVARLLALGCLAGFGLAPRAVQAQEAVVVPEILNYQATLQTLAGASYADGLYPIDVRIWTASTGGMLLWGESYRVYVKGGRLNMLLGQNGTPVSPAGQFAALRDVFKINGSSSDRWLGLTVKADATGAPLTSPVESSPRQQLLTAPFAFQSQYAMYASQAGTNSSFVAPNGVSVSGAPGNFYGGLNSTAGLTVSGAPTELFSPLYAQGAAAFSNTVTFAGTVTNKNGLDVSGPTSLRGGATVNGGATINNGATINGATTINNGPTINGGATVIGALNIPNGVNNGSSNLTLTTSGEFQVRANTVSGLVSPGIVYVSRLSSNGNVASGGPVVSDGFVIISIYHSFVRLQFDFNGDGTYEIDRNIYATINGADQTMITMPVSKGGKYVVTKTDNLNVGGWVDTWWLPMGGVH